MFRRVVVGAALLAAVAAGVRAETLMDYKNIGSDRVIAEAVSDIGGDDAEGRRAASDRLLALVKAEAVALGSDPNAEATFTRFTEGMLELVLAGKATSRVRAERLMEEAFAALGEALKSGDKAKVDAAARSLASMDAAVAKNPDSSSSEKFSATIKELFASASIDPATLIPPAPAPLETAQVEKPAEAGTEAAPVAVSQPQPAQAPANAPTPAAPPVEEPVAVVKAEPAPTPKQTSEVRIIAVAVQPPPPPRPRTRDFPLSPVVVSSSALYADNPAYKVTTVVAPERSRPGYREAQAKADQIIRRKLAFMEEAEPNASLINIILDQLKSPDPRRIDSGLKLTSRVSEVILAARAKDMESNATMVLARARELLGHPEGRVKRSAALAATALKDKLAVRPLIDLLKSEEESTISTARAALYSIVGVDLGLNQRPWLDWASMNQPR